MDDMACDRAEKSAANSKQLVNSMVERRAQAGNYTSWGGDDELSGSFSMTMEVQMSVDSHGGGQTSELDKTEISVENNMMGL